MCTAVQDHQVSRGGRSGTRWHSTAWLANLCTCSFSRENLLVHAGVRCKAVHNWTWLTLCCSVYLQQQPQHLVDSGSSHDTG